MTVRWQNYPLGAIPSGDSSRDLLLGLYVDKARLFDALDVPAMPDLAAIPLLGGGLPQPDADPLYNEVAGSCVVSAAGHHVNLTAQHAGLGKLVTAEMVRKAYTQLTGYDPITGANDVGLVPRLFFAAWKSGRLNLGCKLLAYGRLNKDDLEEITLATALFGGTLGAYDLPLISQGQADNQGRPQWFRPSGGWPEHQGPGTWGAHMIYHHGIRTGNTWGVSVVEDPEWHNDCCFELWFALLDISRLATGRAVNGFEFEQLLSDARTRANE